MGHERPGTYLDSGSGGSISSMLNLSADAPREPRDFYRRRADELGLEAHEAIRLRGSYQVGFILLGVLGCILLYQAFVTKRLPIWMPFSLVPIGALVGSQMKRSQDKALRLLRIGDYYASGIARLDHEWDSLDEGQEFADPNHFYATDLDLFGRGSLFQLLCSARTHVGREMLATWMKTPASQDEVLARRDAISEVRAHQRLFESVAAAGM